MNNLIEKIKQPARLIAAIGFFVCAGIFLITDLSGFDDEFFPVVSQLLYVIFMSGLFVLAGLLLLFGKLENGKFLIGGLLAFLVLQLIVNGVGAAGAIQSGANALYVIGALMALLAAISLMFIVVLSVVGLFKDHSLKGLVSLILVCLLIVYFLYFLFMLIYYLTLETAFMSILYLMYETLFLPFTVIFTVLALN